MLEKKNGGALRDGCYTPHDGENGRFVGKYVFMHRLVSKNYVNQNLSHFNYFDVQKN